MPEARVALFALCRQALARRNEWTRLVRQPFFCAAQSAVGVSHGVRKPDLNIRELRDLNRSRRVVFD
jgi:hypothetical protein